MPRVVVLGAGTGVGKTRVSVALLRALATRGVPTLGLKPIESGILRGVNDEPAPDSDAAALAAAGSLQTTLPHPLYALGEPISPHLAARRAGVELDVARCSDWVATSEESVAPRVSSHSALWTVVETAGGVFSPLGVATRNFELARALGPAIWLLVAPDALGVLHDLGATLGAMNALGRLPDHVLLSAARAPDASTGTNAAELTTLGIVRPSAVLARNDDSGIAPLVEHLLATAG